MSILITEDQFHSVFPRNPSPGVWASRISTALEKAGFTTGKQVAMFLAQCGHESIHFTVFEERLNYSSKNLLKVFGKYFNEEEAEAYAGKPEMIANRVYAGRMENGLESSGDGWKYRGRGPIQITGKENYRKCSKELYGDESVLLDNPDLLVQKPEEGLKAALWYWKSRKLQSVESVEHATKLINGGTNGLEERKELYDRAMKALK